MVLMIELNVLVLSIILIGDLGVIVIMSSRLEFRHSFILKRLKGEP